MHFGELAILVFRSHCQKRKLKCGYTNDNVVLLDIGISINSDMDVAYSLIDGWMDDDG